MLKDLVQTYYSGIAGKSGWEEPLSREITFNSPGAPAVSGKAAFVKATNAFLRFVKAATPKQTLYDSDTACVWMAYDLVSPTGREGSLDVLEIWKSAAERLDNLTIYFDRAAFGQFMQS